MNKRRSPRGQRYAFPSPFTRAKTLAMVARYAHQNGSHIRTAMEKLSQRIERTGSGDVVSSIPKKVP